MKTFKGFTDSESFTQLPDTFFHQLLSQIDNGEELKVTLYFLWHVQHMDGSFHALRESDFSAEILGLDTDEISSGIKKAVNHGTLLRAEHKTEVLYFLNSPRGRAAATAFIKGKPVELPEIAPTLLERQNIFRLYEENIGPLTPLIADALKDAEETYSPEWIAEAIDLAVRNNKRSWRYCEAILKRWKEEGHGEKQDGRDTEKDRRQNVKRKIEDFLGK
jgi:DNA replication protein